MLEMLYDDQALNIDEHSACPFLEFFLPFSTFFYLHGNFFIMNFFHVLINVDDFLQHSIQGLFKKKNYYLNYFT